MIANRVSNAYANSKADTDTRISISSEDLVSVQDLIAALPKGALALDMVYADSNHPENVFKTALYRTGADCWLHKDMAAVVALSALTAHTIYGYTLLVFDGYRSPEAQAIMNASAVVMANPEWVNSATPMLSKVGGGSHPRAMAVDVSLLDENGARLDMGTAFDTFPEVGGVNKAERGFLDFSDNIEHNARIFINRTTLEGLFLSSGFFLKTPVYALPQEWWHFQLPIGTVDSHAPLSDSDLPQYMRMTEVAYGEPETLSDGEITAIKTAQNKNLEKILGKNEDYLQKILTNGANF